MRFFTTKPKHDKNQYLLLFDLKFYIDCFETMSVLEVYEVRKPVGVKKQNNRSKKVQFVYTSFGVYEDPLYANLIAEQNSTVESRCEIKQYLLYCEEGASAGRIIQDAPLVHFVPTSQTTLATAAASKMTRDELQAVQNVTMLMRSTRIEH